LSGVVLDSALHAIAQARLEVVDGPLKGTVAVTSAAGAFVFDPIVSTALTLRASKEGYLNESIAVADGQTGVRFMLDSVNGPFHLNGEYEITFEADGACASLPPAARARTYSGRFGGDDAFVVTLHGAAFGAGMPPSYTSWNAIYFQMRNDVAHIYFSDPPIWEHLTPDADLVIEGNDASGVLLADMTRWSYTGSFSYCADPERGEPYPECGVPLITCQSQNHQLTLKRK